MAQENTWFARRDGSDTGLLIDPGDEPERIQAALDELGVKTVEAILLTHTHFDHVGAVAPMAKATGAPVYCPKLEVPVLADIMAWVPWPGIGPFESYDADETLEGGEQLELAGPRDRRAVHARATRPATSPTRSPPSGVLFSGDVLFQGSIGRTDLPGGDHQRLLRSIGELLEALPGETARAARATWRRPRSAPSARTNPFLHELSA